MISLHKKHAGIALIAVILGLMGCQPSSDSSASPVLSPVEGSASSLPTATVHDEDSSSSMAPEPVSVIAHNLTIPWSLAFLPTGDLLVTERPGTLLRISNDDHISYPIHGVHHRGEGGLLGVTLHPHFARTSWIYLYLTTNEDGNTTNRVERYHLDGHQLTERTVILDDIPGSVYHDGGRLAFGPDGFLYITTGDAGNEQAAQDTTSLAGNILRINDDGSIPADNPFGNAVYSYGHRNPQGLTWDNQGRLWSTEHGRSGVLSGYDELNRIEKGKNYGWPVIQGSETRTGMETPILHSGASDTWAPASAQHLNGSIFFGGLKGEALYEAILSSNTETPPQLKTHFKNTYGRIRDVVLGPDGALYLSTSNRDGRGKPSAEDDRIIRIDPSKL